jgi:outer membrane protein assembly factor BamB
MTRRVFAGVAVLAACALLCAGIGLAAAPPGQDWPQWRGAQRDGVWRETGLLEKLPGPDLPLRWKAPVANGYSGPTVANGRVYITDRVTEPQQQERVHCFEWQTGKPLWSHRYDAAYGGVGYPDGPRASVTVHDGRAYALGAVGHLHCLDAATGEVLWNRDLQREYDIDLPNWGIAAAPLVEGELVIVQIGGRPEACVAAFDRKTGEERWKALADRASYSAPIVIEQAGRRVAAVWTADRVVGLNPETGAVHWAADFPASRWPIAVATPAVDGDRMFLSSALDGSLMLRVPRDRLAAEPLWKRSGPPQAAAALHCLISTPVLEGDYVYGVDNSGELRCLDAKTGDRLWESLDVVPKANWATAHLVRNGERTWIFNEKGELIIARLTPEGYHEISRAKLIGPTLGQLNDRRRGGVAWSHPAFAYGHVFARNDDELVCADLRASR